MAFIQVIAPPDVDTDRRAVFYLFLQPTVSLRQRKSPRLYPAEPVCFTDFVLAVPEVSFTLEVPFQQCRILFHHQRVKIDIPFPVGLRPAAGQLPPDTGQRIHGSVCHFRQLLSACPVIGNSEHIQLPQPRSRPLITGDIIYFYFFSLSLQAQIEGIFKHLVAQPSR